MLYGNTVETVGDGVGDHDNRFPVQSPLCRIINMQLISIGPGSVRASEGGGGERGTIISHGDPTPHFTGSRYVSFLETENPAAHGAGSM